MPDTATPDKGKQTVVAQASGYVEGMNRAAVKSDEIEIEDAKGQRVTVSRAHWNRWPSLRESFRPVAEKKATLAPGNVKNILAVNQPEKPDEEVESN